MAAPSLAAAAATASTRAVVTSGRAPSWTRTTSPDAARTPAATKSCRRAPPATTRAPRVRTHARASSSSTCSAGGRRSTMPATAACGGDCLGGALQDGPVAEQRVELVLAAHAGAAARGDHHSVREWSGGLHPRMVKHRKAPQRRAAGVVSCASRRVCATQSCLRARVVSARTMLHLGSVAFEAHIDQKPPRREPGQPSGWLDGASGCTARPLSFGPTVDLCARRKDGPSRREGGLVTDGAGVVHRSIRAPGATAREPGPSNGPGAGSEQWPGSRVRAMAREEEGRGGSPILEAGAALAGRRQGPAGRPCSLMRC